MVFVVLFRSFFLRHSLGFSSMAILHLRDLSAYGVISDVDPFNIPTNAFSYGLNVRFDDGSVERAVVFRNIDAVGNGVESDAIVYDGTSIGDLTGGGGLATAFDNDTTETMATSATKAAATSGYVGKSLVGVSAVHHVKVYGSDDQGYVSGANPTVTLTLYGKTGAAPASATDGTSLGTTSFTDTANESTARTVNSSDTTTTWDHIWVAVSHDGAAATIGVAELDIFTQRNSARFVTTFVGPSGDEEIIIAYKDGTAAEWTVGGTEVDRSPPTYAAADSDGLFTSCQLGGVLYLNRNDRVPWDWKPADTEFEELAGGWDANWRCNILRSYNDALCAFNLTEGASEYPTKVRTSDLVTYGAIPTTWDETDPTNNATSNILAEMRGDIVEAQTLQSSMIIYTNQETWVMQADGSDNVYSYRRLYNDTGAMSANCAVELEGKHYVFGYKDIWVHDGVGKESICNSRVRKKVFTQLDYSNSFRCYVLANEVLSEIYFCYRDGAAFNDDFSQVPGCNMAAVYNYKNNTWGFLTLPNTYAGTSCVIGNPVTYDETSEAYDEMAVSYFNLGESSKRVPVMVGDVYSGYSLTASLYGLDMDGDQSILAFATDPNATLNWYLEKDGCDLDELNENLRGYKNVVSVYPQARLADDQMTIEFSFGSSDYFGTSPSYADAMTYDNTTLSKLDYKSGGRYLSFKAQGTDGGRRYFRLSGMDFDVETTGDR